MSYVEERPWWLIKSPSKKERKKEESERQRGEQDQIKFIDPRFESDETHGFGQDFVKKTESRFWSTTPDVGAVL